MLSLNINTAQIMLVKNITGEKKTIPGQDKHARYLQKFFPAFLKKAMTILTTEKYLAEIIAEKYPFATGKIFPVYHGLNKNWRRGVVAPGHSLKNNERSICPVRRRPACRH